MEHLEEVIISKLIYSSEEQLEKEIILNEREDLRNLSLSSLTIIKWIVLLEEEFNIEIDIEEVIVQEQILWSLTRFTKFIRNEIQSETVTES